MINMILGETAKNATPFNELIMINALGWRQGLLGEADQLPQRHSVSEGIHAGIDLFQVDLG